MVCLKIILKRSLELHSYCFTDEDLRDINRWASNKGRDLGVEAWWRIAGTIWHDGKEQSWEFKGSADENQLDLPEKSVVRLLTFRGKSDDESYGGIIDYPKIGKKYTHVLAWERRHGRPKAKCAEIDHLIPSGALVPNKLCIATDMLQEVPRSVNRRRGAEQGRKVREASGTLKSPSPGVSANGNGFVVDVSGFSSKRARTLEEAIALRDTLRLSQIVKEEKDWDSIGGRPKRDTSNCEDFGVMSDADFRELLRKRGIVPAEDQPRRMALETYRKSRTKRVAQKMTPMNKRSSSVQKPVRG